MTRLTRRPTIVGAPHVPASRAPGLGVKAWRFVLPATLSERHFQVTSSDCPSCGTPRQGSSRFCANCAFDYWSAAQAAQPATTTPPPAAARRRTGRRVKWIAGGVALLVVVGVTSALANQPADPTAGGAPSAAASPDDARTSIPAPSPTVDEDAEDCRAQGGIWNGIQDRCEIVPDDTPQPIATPVPAPVTTTFGVGETVTVTSDGRHPSTSSSAKSPRPRRTPTPMAITRTSRRSPGTSSSRRSSSTPRSRTTSSYNPFDWQVFVDGQAVDNYAFAINGPKPDLGSGTLPAGRTRRAGSCMRSPPKAKSCSATGPTCSRTTRRSSKSS